MGYTLSPLHSPTPLTFPRLAQTFDAAFSDHPLIPYLYPHTPPQARLENDVKKFEGEWARREAEGLRWWVVREDGEGEGDGEIVAWAKWVVPHEIGEEERKSGEIGGWPEGANVELCEEFFGKLREGRRRWVGEEEYCEFLFLCSRGLCHSLFELFSTTLQVDGWVTIFFSTPLFGQPVIVELCFTASHDVSCLLFTKLIYLNSSGRLQFHTFPISHLAISKPTISQASNPLPLKSILLLLSSSSQIHPSTTLIILPKPPNPV